MARPFTLEGHAAIVLQVHMIDKDSAALVARLGRPQAVEYFLLRGCAIVEKSLVLAHSGGINLSGGHTTSKTTQNDT